MIKRTYTVAAAVWLGTALPCLAHAVEDAVVQASGLVFRGTVKATGRSNLKGLTATDKSIVVRVDELLKAPPALESILGRDVTVQQQAPSLLRKGQGAIFYATGLAYGESLALQEVATVTGRIDMDDLRGQ